jgi:hypothetical protein
VFASDGGNDEHAFAGLVPEFQKILQFIQNELVAKISIMSRRSESGNRAPICHILPAPN